VSFILQYSSSIIFFDSIFDFVKAAATTVTRGHFSWNRRWRHRW